MAPTNRWLELSVSKMDNDHLVNILTDISKSKEAQLNIEKTVEELKRSNSNLEEFAYAASHDMKEPIRKIQYFSDRLKARLGKKIDTEEANMFGRIESAAGRMQQLIDDLLTYSQVSIKPREVETIDLNDKIKKILDDLEIPLQEKAARIIVEPLPVIKGYRLQMQQLFQNLIGNALKYSKPGVIPEIKIASKKINATELPASFNAYKPNSSYHVIEIADNGIGFEQKDAERIFQMFQRLHGTAEYKGTGVGLSIARKVVNNHEGYIIAESEPGIGSVFKVYLPA
jgi:light-regulated signal transduction histidine kinase (bacteriophytochrome)